MTASLPYFLDHIWMIPLFPLATAAAMLFLGRRLKNDAVSVLCVGSVFLSFICSVGAFFQLLSLSGDNRIVDKHLFDFFDKQASFVIVDLFFGSFDFFD